MSLDYTKFYEVGAAPKPSEGQAAQWWQLEGPQQADAVSEALGILARQADARNRQLLISARLYGNLTASLGALGMERYHMAYPTMREKITFNVVQSATDTIVSKTTKNRPKPLFLTSGGDYQEQRRAKKLSKFVEGLFYEQQAYRVGATIMRDGCIWGDGVTHVFEKNDRVCHERVLPQEILVDELEALYGEPRTLYRVKAVDRRQLVAAYPDFEKEVLQAPQARTGVSWTVGTTSDLVELREAWHLPSGVKAEDGRHCLSIDRCVLSNREWTREAFPFVRFTWQKRLYGFWGQGLVEQIQNIQFEISRVLATIQRSFQLGGSFKVLVENGSKIVKEHLSADIGAIICYTGTKPEYIVPPLVSPEIYSHLRTLRDAAYELAGVSQLSASSKKPEGLDSGKAIRAFNDIETERFVTVGQAYEQYYLDLARVSVQEAQSIAERSRGHYRVLAPGGGRAYDLDLKDVDLDSSSYVMQAFPIASLPSDPSGRWQTVQEYVQAGWYTQRQGKQLMNFPDTESADGLESAAEDYIEMVLDRVVDEGVATPPDPLDDLVLARTRALEYYERGKTNGLAPERLELLRVFIQQIDDLVQPVPPEQPLGPPEQPVAAVPPPTV